MRINPFTRCVKNNVARVTCSLPLCAMGAVVLLLLGCSATNKTAPTEGTKTLTSDVQPMRGWHSYALPGKQATTFAFVKHQGRNAVRATAQASASMLRQQLRVNASDLGKLQFSWMVPQLIERADMGVRELDDSPVRVILVFEGDRSQFSMKNAMLSELSMAMTGEPLPYATLMYVWCNTRTPGSVIVNPRTDRIRKLVVESGAGKLGFWLDYERDVRRDFEHAFGEPPGALLGVAIMTDTDNTRTEASAWYGPLSLMSSR